MTTLKAHGLELFRLETVEHDEKDGTDWRTTISVRSCGAVLVKRDWRYNPPRDSYRDGYQSGSWSHIRNTAGKRHPAPWKTTEEGRPQSAETVWTMVHRLWQAGHKDVQVRTGGRQDSAWPVAGCRAQRR